MAPELAAPEPWFIQVLKTKASKALRNNSIQLSQHLLVATASLAADQIILSQQPMQGNIIPVQRLEASPTQKHQEFGTHAFGEHHERSRV